MTVGLFGHCYIFFLFTFCFLFFATIAQLKNKYAPDLRSGLAEQPLKGQ
jgi:hypothetical protein